MYGLMRERSRLHESSRWFRGVAEPDGSRRLIAPPLFGSPGSPVGTCASPGLEADQQTGEHAMPMMDCDDQTTSRLVALAA